MNVRLIHFHLKLHQVYQLVLLLDQSICKISNQVLVFPFFYLHGQKDFYVQVLRIISCNLKTLKPFDKFLDLALKHTRMTIRCSNNPQV